MNSQERVRFDQLSTVGVITVAGLRKSYGSVDTVADISFTVDQGEVEILEGYRSRDADDVRVVGWG